jgi:hypothetical protein
MNIFYLDHNPTTAAKAMTDKHVVKMILESAQLLSTAHRVLDGKTIVELSKNGRRLTRYSHPTLDDVLYKSTHINHPSGVWVRESQENYLWLYKHFVALCLEYTARYSKVHASFTKLNSVLSSPPFNIASSPFTPIKLAMPVPYHLPDPVESYRYYYESEKLHIDTDKLRYKNILFQEAIYETIN